MGTTFSKAEEEPQTTSSSNAKVEHESGEEVVKENEDDEGEEDGEDGGGGEFKVSNEMIQSIMSEEGPVVKAVHITHDGKVEEIELDMTPRDRNMDKLLGDSGITIIGGYDDISAVVLSGRNILSPDCKFRLPFPLHESKVKGDICIYRSDENGIPLDFFLKEFNDLRNKIPSPEDIQKYQAEKLLRSENVTANSMKLSTFEEVEHDEEEEEEEEGEEYTAQDAANEENESDADDLSEGEDNDDEVEDGMHAKMNVLANVMKEFSAVHGRMPTMEEVKDTLKDALEAVDKEDGEEDEEEDLEAENEEDGPSEEDDDEELSEEKESGVLGSAEVQSFEVLDLLIKEFVQINGRNPTPEELTQWQEALGSVDQSSLVLGDDQTLETPIKVTDSEVHVSFASPDTVLMSSTPSLHKRKQVEDAEIVDEDAARKVIKVVE